MKKHLLSKILLKVESFPSMPKVGAKLLVLLKDSNDANIQIDIVYIANLLCRINETENQGKKYSARLSPALIKRLGIEPDELELISGKIAQWNDRISKKLSLDAN
jgi:hypothetical protein